MRAAIAFTTELTRLVPEEMAAIIMNNHDSLSKLSSRQNEAESK
jgi:hypothetical protein